jgi:hypothetical protein
MPYGTKSFSVFIDGRREEYTVDAATYRATVAQLYTEGASDLRPERGPEPVRLTNESALGIYRLTWGKPRQAGRCEVVWYDGAAGPFLSLWLTGQNRMSPPLEIRNPERFGWTGPPRKLADFQAFVQRFAAEGHAHEPA